MSFLFTHYFIKSISSFLLISTILFCYKAKAKATSLASSGSVHGSGYTVVRYNFIKVTHIFPKINSFSPASGTAGTLVYVQGADLLLVKTLTIGGQAAIIVSNSGTVLVGMVMPGAVSGPVLLNGQPSSGLADFSVSSKHLPFSAQGSKLTAADNVQAAEGSSVAVSADGNTMIAGGPGDHGGLGAAFIYTRVAGIWSQQGTKLVGSGAVGNSRQGNAVSINADGTTVLVGGFKDNAGTGAAWVFTRSGQSWIQQGSKLTGADMNGNAWMGQAVSISADGNTALIGGGYDHNAQGAAWIYNRKNGIWSQNGAKLSGSAGVGSSLQGKSVALSADGAIAVLGGFNDNAGMGAAWIFSLNDGIWMQQGQKLIGNGYSGTNIEQGWSVALNGDGSRLIVGGRADSFNIGASWIFSRSGTSWTQDGMKLVANDNTGQSEQASSVAITADGNTAIIGGLADNNGVGASWIFIREEGFWIQQGLKFIGAGSSQAALQGNSVAISADGGTAFSGGFVDNNSTGASWAFSAGAPVPVVVPPVQTGPVPPPPIIHATGSEPIASNLVTPNSDGKNDTWIVKNIFSYPLNRVTIFDYLGRVVYAKTAYGNDWAGTCRGRPLPEGTYYYLVDYGNGSRLGRGFVTVMHSR